MPNPVSPVLGVLSLFLFLVQLFPKVNLATVRAPTAVDASQVAGEAEGLPEAAPPGHPRGSGHLPTVSPRAEKEVRSSRFLNTPGRRSEGVGGFRVGEGLLQVLIERKHVPFRHVRGKEVRHFLVHPGHRIPPV